MFLKGLGRGLLGHAGPMATEAGAKGLAMGGMLRANNTFRGAVGGAVLGGAWGAVSDDTSVLGGMTMGALGGAGVGRYGGAGLKYAQASRGGMRGFVQGMKSQARLDYRQGARALGIDPIKRTGQGTTMAASAPVSPAAVAAAAPEGATMAASQPAAGSAVASSLKKSKRPARAARRAAQRQASQAYVGRNNQAAAKAFRADTTRERLLAERAARQGRGGFTDPMDRVRAAQMSQMERIVRNSQASGAVKSGFSASPMANFERSNMGRTLDDIINRGQRPDTAAEIAARLRMNFGI